MKKLNNKGFSLVELIIVIAIMAILVGVVGTQVIPYLEKSRQAKDMQVFSGWNTAGMSTYSMNADKITGATEVTITITKSSLNFSNDGPNGELKETFKSLTALGDDGFKDVTFASKAGKEVYDGGTVTISIDVSTGRVTTTVTGDSKNVFGTIENK